MLDLLSEEQKREVNGYIERFPELKTDLYDIQRALQVYAESHGITPRRNLEPDIISAASSSDTQSAVKENTKVAKRASLGSWLLLALVTIGALSYIWRLQQQHSTLSHNYDALISSCDSLDQSRMHLQDKYLAIVNKSNQPKYFAATENYPDTRLILHHNPVNHQNFIQINGCPKLDAGMALQLWSLKEGQDPIALTVFDPFSEDLIPVDYEEGTSTYAITIEKKEGVQSPTLSRLVATVGV